MVSRGLEGGQREAYIWKKTVLQRGDLLVNKSQAFVCCRRARLGLLDLHGGNLLLVRSWYEGGGCICRVSLTEV